MVDQWPFVIFFLQQNEWIEARNMCNKVLEERTDIPKAYFRRGEAHFQLKDYELAMNDFQNVIDLDADNKVGPKDDQQSRKRELSYLN